MTSPIPSIPNPLRVTLDEGAQALRLSRSEIQRRIRTGQIRAHHDGRRVYITAAELQRYVDGVSQAA